MFTFALMLAASAELPSYTLPPAKRAAPDQCSDACASRYRLPGSADPSPSAKYRALAEDGTECNMVRAKICRQKPRTWIRAAY